MWFGRIALALTVRAKILTHDDLRPPPLSAARIFADGQAVPLDGWWAGTPLCMTSEYACGAGANATRGRISASAKADEWAAREASSAGSISPRRDPQAAPGASWPRETEPRR